MMSAHIRGVSFLNDGTKLKASNNKAQPEQFTRLQDSRVLRCSVASPKYVEETKEGGDWIYQHVKTKGC